VTKNKLQRFAEMKRFDNVIEPSFDEIFQKDHKYKGRWHEQVFGNDNPIVLELGCGKGEYTVNLARSYPGYNFLGIDIKGARMWKGAKAALQDGLPNAKFLRTRIDFIRSFFAEREISEIWITFPDPQPKKPLKRLVSTRFLTRYQQFLHDRAVIHLKTDNTDVYHYAGRVARANNLEMLREVDDVHHTEDQALEKIRNIQTFYEKQFIAENKKIKYLAFRLDIEKPLKEPPDEE
jgi:tRNA (guanine-N7-)-methyltransferase